jgi:hypothetical protein
MLIMELVQRTQTEINKICSINPVETTWLTYRITKDASGGILAK